VEVFSIGGVDRGFVRGVGFVTRWFRSTFYAMTLANLGMTSH